MPGWIPYFYAHACSSTTLYRLREPKQKLLKLRSHFFIGHRSGRIEHATRARDQQAPSEPRPGAKRAQHRQPGVLRQDSSETSWRGTDNRHRPVAEDTCNIGRWPRQPVDGVFHDPGHRVVVFRRCQQQAVATRYLLFEELNRRRNAVALLRFAGWRPAASVPRQRATAPRYTKQCAGCLRVPEY
jgi:hypothetical protein